jgi:hypothetical protein
MAQPYPPSSSHVSPRPTEPQPDSTTGLLSRLVDELSTLLRKELALAKAELSESINQAKIGAISLAAGGAVLFAALLVLLSAATFALAHIVSDWLAALIIGVITAIAGFVMLQSGKKKFDASRLKPERTQDAFRRDKDMVERRIS